MIGIETGQFYPINKGTGSTLNLYYSRLDTREGRNSFILIHQSPAQNWHFQTIVASPSLMMDHHF